MKHSKNTIWGVLVCIGIAMFAYILASVLPLGAVALAILVGAVVGNLRPLPHSLKSGVNFSAGSILAVAVALMGVNLNFGILQQLGWQSILLLIVGIVVTLGMATLLARFTKWNPTLLLVLAIGNGVCGSSAIIATKEIVGVDEEDVGIAIAVVNFLGTIGMFVVPMLGATLFGLPDVTTGIWVGNTLQSMGQVTAGGFAVSELAGQTATVVKLGRILMLLPVMFTLIFVNRKNSTVSEESPPLIQRIPLFVLGFIAFSLVATFGLLPTNILDGLSQISKYCLIVAMAGLGLKITFATILNQGRTALLYGTIIFSVQIVFTGLALWMFF